MGEDQIDGQPCGAAFLVVRDAIGERSLAELDTHVPLTDPNACDRATLEVIEIERLVCIGEPVRLECGGPIAPLERRASISQEINAARGRLIHAFILTLEGRTRKDALERPLGAFGVPDCTGRLILAPRCGSVRLVAFGQVS